MKAPWKGLLFRQTWRPKPHIQRHTRGGPIPDSISSSAFDELFRLFRKSVEAREKKKIEEGGSGLLQGKQGVGLLACLAAWLPGGLSSLLFVH